ncbi:Hypothetical protein NTJ_12324 [Nesidiocoris tenuis]|uniref:THAP-type domain-containing protein n=1 Tax=Nesidiocoris tenuis TaxID=355587 RepID=A0ABN7B517_9HEMI|nr:Hypothetical protein NTJ_12324 [Nesidiocoris tenuis]
MPGSHRYCSFGQCNSSGLVGRPGYEVGTKFYRFPQPCLLLRDNVLTWDDATEEKHVRNCDKCRTVQEWMTRCERNDARFKKVRQISPNLFICSKHFVHPPAIMDYKKFVPDSSASCAARREIEVNERLMREYGIRRDHTSALTPTDTGSESFCGTSEQTVGIEPSEDVIIVYPFGFEIPDSIKQEGEKSIAQIKVEEWAT